MKYGYKDIQHPADYGKGKDELQEFLNNLNRTEGEIVAVIPQGNRYITVIYKY